MAPVARLLGRFPAVVDDGRNKYIHASRHYINSPYQILN